MPNIIQACAYLPPSFALQRRLPSESWQVARNLHRQSDQERAYHDSLCVAAGRRVTAPCCKTLHISLCFDGTGNNKYFRYYMPSVGTPFPEIGEEAGLLMPEAQEALLLEQWSNV